MATGVSNNPVSTPTTTSITVSSGPSNTTTTSNAGSSGAVTVSSVGQAAPSVVSSAAGLSLPTVSSLGPVAPQVPSMIHLTQVAPPAPFDFKSADVWEKWSKRFTRYRLASGLHMQAQSVQVNSLLYSMGDEADDLLLSFHLSDQDADNYDIVFQKFADHYGRKRNLVYERAKFHQRSQQPGESIDGYITDLFRLAERCNFKQLHDEMIRDRLVAGVADTALSQKLQLDPSLTLDKALAQARQKETVRTQQSTVRHSSSAGATLHQVHAFEQQHHSACESCTCALELNALSMRPQSHQGVKHPAQYNRDSTGHASQPRSTHSYSGHPRSSQSAPRHSSGVDQSSTCHWCGKERHARTQCPARQAKCSFCSKIGHFAVVCMQKHTSSSQSASNTSHMHSLQSSAASSGPLQSADQWHYPPAYLGALSADTGWSMPMLLQSVPVTMKVDTGADVTAIPASLYDDISAHHQLSLQESDRTLKGPDNATLAVSGRVTLSICRSAFSDFAVDTTVYVVPHLKTPLLGRPAIEALHIFSPPADLLSATTGTSEQSSVKSQYPELFAGVGSFGSEHTIRLVDNAQPYSLPTPRRISLPMEAKVIEELQALEQSGVIRKVTEPTDWCAGMVVVPKPNGNVRICGDFTRLNQAIRRERHIMPTTDHLLARLGTAKVFSKLDANKGFHQIPLSLESQLLTTFITPIGRFCFRRLPFGISSAPEYFQKQMSDLLSDLPGTICMIDDVLTFGDDEHEEEKNLHAVLQRLSSAGITLNPDKCAFQQRSVKFLGHILDDNGIHPDPQKVRGVQELKPCTDVPAVRRFLGMANQLGKFVPDLATMPRRSEE
eukprot:scpid23188/ scgid27451/ Retrovirus-related Pol polyprotein from transposon opus; Protease; Reverse transcriptase; Endonuclease